MSKPQKLCTIWHGMTLAGGSCSEKKYATTYQLKWKKKGYTMIEGRNQLKFFSARGNGKHFINFQDLFISSKYYKF